MEDVEDREWDLGGRLNPRYHYSARDWGFLITTLTQPLSLNHSHNLSLSILYIWDRHTAQKRKQCGRGMLATAETDEFVIFTN